MKSKEKMEFVINRIKEIIKLYPNMYKEDRGYSLSRLITLQCMMGNLKPNETDIVIGEVMFWFFEEIV